MATMGDVRRLSESFRKQEGEKGRTSILCYIFIKKTDELGRTVLGQPDSQDYPGSLPDSFILGPEAEAQFRALKLWCQYNGLHIEL